MHHHGERSTEKVALVVLVLAIFSDAVTWRAVEACPGTQKCTTIAECRKIQKESKYQMELGTSVLYPCEETLPGMICCAVGSKQETELKEQETVNGEDPGYTITYGDGPQASEPVPEALPLQVGERLKNGDTCGTFEKGNSLEDASYKQFPWLALIGSNDAAGESIQFHCGGTLINYRYVLTSASCISNMESPPVMVRLGEYDISKEDDCGRRCTAIDSDVDQIIIHESYDYPLRKNDIALLRLKDSLPKDKENIVPICLPTENLKYDTYTVAGWGINDQRQFTVKPKFGTLSLDTPKLCEAELSLPLQPLGEKQLCSKSGSCFGDGGGPLMAYIKNGFKQSAVVAGIISERGPNCNSPFTVDLFTNVAYYLDWIANNTRE